MDWVALSFTVFEINSTENWIVPITKIWTFSVFIQCNFCGDAIFAKCFLNGLLMGRGRWFTKNWTFISKGTLKGYKLEISHKFERYLGLYTVKFLIFIQFWRHFFVGGWTADDALLSAFGIFFLKISRFYWSTSHFLNIEDLLLIMGYNWTLNPFIFFLIKTRICIQSGLIKMNIQIFGDMRLQIVLKLDVCSIYFYFSL